jgi:23S rRNA (adenine-N6)-dimethyltransferase
VSGHSRADAPRWGWHRLDDVWARRIVAAAAIRPGDLVLDVGAGAGAITAPLVAAGARVVAVELHPGRAAGLRARFDGPGVVVVRADAAALRLPRRPFRVVANPPFAVASALVRRLMAPGSRLVQADLVLPSPVARRWAAGHGPGANRWAATFALDVTTRLPRNAFHPAAPCSVVLLRIVRRESRARSFVSLAK